MMKMGSTNNRPQYYWIDFPSRSIHRLHCIWPTIAGVLLLLSLSAVASKAGDWEICNQEHPFGDDVISACGRLIAAGKLQGNDLIDTYTTRGLARDIAQDHQGAIGDLDQAVSLSQTLRLGFDEAHARIQRSRLRCENGDLDGAVADYEYGRKLLADDRNHSSKFEEMVASMGITLADCARRKGDNATAFRIMQQLADAGDAYAQVNLGSMYEDGRGTSQNYAEAEKLYRLAADKGIAGAQFLLGRMYFTGQGLPQNDREALRLFRLAADKDFADAQAALGFVYFNGLAGVPESYDEAFKWYYRAAAQGYAPAQSELGDLYANGQGIPQDYVRAHMWFNLAAAQGNEEAIKDRDEIASKMTPEQIAEAQKLAHEWKPKSGR